jgi:hypothetical protein
MVWEAGTLYTSLDGGRLSVWTTGPAGEADCRWRSGAWLLTGGPQSDGTTGESGEKTRLEASTQGRFALPLREWRNPYTEP